MKWLTEKQLNIAREYVPIICVDSFICDSKKGLYLKKRWHEPYKGQYSLIGGRIQKWEKSKAALKRHLKEEAGIVKFFSSFLDIIEWGSSVDPRQHAISIVFLVIVNNIKPTSGKFFKTLPKSLVKADRQVIIQHKEVLQCKSPLVI